MKNITPIPRLWDLAKHNTTSNKKELTGRDTPTFAILAVVDSNTWVAAKNE